MNSTILYEQTCEKPCISSESTIFQDSVWCQCELKKSIFFFFIGDNKLPTYLSMNEHDGAEKSPCATLSIDRHEAFAKFAESGCPLWRKWRTLDHCFPLTAPPWTRPPRLNLMTIQFIIKIKTTSNFQYIWPCAYIIDTVKRYMNKNIVYHSKLHTFISVLLQMIEHYCKSSI